MTRAFPLYRSNVGDDRELQQSWRLNIETVPTVIRMENSVERERTVGWDRAEWLRLFELRASGRRSARLSPRLRLEKCRTGHA